MNFVPRSLRLKVNYAEATDVVKTLKRNAVHMAHSVIDNTDYYCG